MSSISLNANSNANIVKRSVNSSNDEQIPTNLFVQQQGVVVQQVEQIRARFIAHLEKGEYDLSIEAAEEGLQIDGINNDTLARFFNDIALAHNHRGKSLDDKGEISYSDAFRFMWSLDPNCITKERYDRALKAAEKGLQIKQGVSPETLVSLFYQKAFTCIQMHKFEEASKASEEGIQKGKDSEHPDKQEHYLELKAIVHNMRARAFLKKTSFPQTPNESIRKLTEKGFEEFKELKEGLNPTLWARFSKRIAVLYLIDSQFEKSLDAVKEGLLINDLNSNKFDRVNTSKRGSLCEGFFIEDLDKIKKLAEAKNPSLF
ncbi:MAG: hypothetical protein K1000chlam3_00862 [Chlamydiae bacterium]|nr:hypothetical protein [Chlamydiota bacterium]